MGVLIVGMFLLIIGIIMIFTPGPAVVFIPAGLAVLATEFEWARRLLHRVRPLIDAAIKKAKEKKEAVQNRRRAKGPLSTDSAPASATVTDRAPSRSPAASDRRAPLTASLSSNRGATSL